MPHRVTIVAHPQALGMELLGVHDILQVANTISVEHGAEPPYRVEIAAAAEEITLWGELSLKRTCDLASRRAAADTIVVVGGPAATAVAQQCPDLVAAVRRLGAGAQRLVGVCTGSFLIAAAGLLDGHRATTHWLAGSELRARHPGVEVDIEPIYVTDGTVWTSAGATSAYDLMLALVETDLGTPLAREAAQRLVLYLRRPGTQSQFAGPRPQDKVCRPQIRQVQDFIDAHPDADLCLSALAERAHMSPRHFARLFSAEVGVSPGRYVERARLNAACRHLCETDATAESVARRAGFTNYQAMRRTFASLLGISPADYRRRFGAPAALEIAV